LDFNTILLVSIAVILLLSIYIIFLRSTLSKIKTSADESQKEVHTLQNTIEKNAIEASQAKDIFLANISHETLTPMNAIMGLSHILLQSTLDASQKRDVKKIKHSAEKLLSVTNNMLDISQLKADKLDIHTDTMTMDALLTGVKEQVATQAVQKGLDLVFDIDLDLPTSFHSDALHLSQILVHLLNNAIKFTQNGHVTLKIKRLKTEHGATLQFSVSDTGIGLTKEQISTLFKAFNQADNKTNRAYEGNGLGLAISKELVERMGGELRVESTYKKGSTFQFSLSLKNAQALDTAQLDSYKEVLKGRKILLFESKINSSKMIQNTLLSCGALVKVVNTEIELQGILNEQRYEIILINLRILRVLQKPDIVSNRCDYIITLENNLDEAVNHKIHVDNRLIKPFTSLTLLKKLFELLTDAKKEKKRAIANTINDIRTLQGSHILLAEDNEGNAMVVEGLLKGSGIKLTVVDNGQKAVEAIMSNPTSFDLVLMDINMPVMDGYAATSMIREYPHLAHIPIVAMTANITKSDVSKSKKIGMQEHLNKPVDTQKFYQTLSDLITPKVALNSDQEPLHASSESDYDFSALIAVGIDIEDGLLRLNGNVETYLNILQKFAEMFESFEKEFMESFNSTDFKKGRELAHNLKGVAGNIGAKEVYRLATNLENSFKAKGEDFVINFGNLAPVLAPMIDAIKRLENLQKTTENTLRSSEVITLLKEIYYGSKNRKALEVKNAYKKIEDYPWPEAYLPYTIDLNKGVSSYDFHTIRQTIEKIMKQVKQTQGEIL